MGGVLPTTDRPRNRTERRRRARSRGSHGDLHQYVRSLSSRELRRLAGRPTPATVAAATAVSWALTAAPTAADPPSIDPPSIAGVPRSTAAPLPPLDLTSLLPPLEETSPDPPSIAGVPRPPLELTVPPPGSSAPAPAGEAPGPGLPLYQDPPSIAGVPRPPLDLAFPPEAGASPPLAPLFTDPPSIAGNPRPSLFDAEVVRPPLPIEFFAGYGKGLGGEASIIWGPRWGDFQLSTMGGLYLGGRFGGEVATDRPPGWSLEAKGSGTIYELFKAEAGVSTPLSFDHLTGVTKFNYGPLFTGGRMELAPDFGEDADVRGGRQVSIGPRFGWAGAAGLRWTSERYNLYDDIWSPLYNETMYQLGLGGLSPYDPRAIDVPVEQAAPPADHPLLDAPLPPTITDPAAPAGLAPFDPRAIDVPVDPTATTAPSSAPADPPAPIEPIVFDNPSTTMDDASADDTAPASYAPSTDTSSSGDVSSAMSSYSPTSLSSYDPQGMDVPYEPYVPEPMESVAPIAPLDTAPISGRDSFDPGSIDTPVDTGLGSSYDSSYDTSSTGFDSSYDSGYSSYDSGMSGGYSSGGE